MGNQGWNEGNAGNGCEDVGNVKKGGVGMRGKRGMHGIKVGILAIRMGMRGKRIQDEKDLGGYIGTGEETRHKNNRKWMKYQSLGDNTK